MFNEPIPIKLDRKTFINILQKTQAYYILDKNIFGKEQTDNAPVLVQAVLFYTKNFNTNPKPKAKYIGVLKTLTYPQKIGNKYITNICKFMDAHQDLAWFNEANSDLAHNLALCASGGYILTKNSQNHIETQCVWDI